MADYAVVMANLIMAGKNLGPHAFVMQVGRSCREGIGDYDPSG